MDWRDEARDDINSLKPHFVQKHGWEPQVTEPADEEALDLLVKIDAKRLDGRVFLLRLRYRPDWKVAGRRESFVDPEDPSHEGPAFWPPDSIRAVKPNHSPPCICLRGVWGYHSVLHTDRPMSEDCALLGFLLELQKVMDK